MPSLPASPNLEHLKGQAKQLLKLWRSEQAEAIERVRLIFPASTPSVQLLRLSDAQLVVAREYGFLSWTKLKTYVQAVEAQTQQVPTDGQRRTTRQQFIINLARDLQAWAAVDAKVLGARFARMPLRDILSVRAHLIDAGDVPEVVNGLLNGLAHEEARVRFDCALALDHMADERCAEPLQRLLSDAVPRVRRAALHSLSCDACKIAPMTQSGDFLPVLVEMALHDPSVRVRRAAVPLLETYCRDERAVDTLRTLAAANDEVISREARRLLRRRGELE